MYGFETTNEYVMQLLIEIQEQMFFHSFAGYVISFRCRAGDHTQAAPVT